MQKEWYVVNTYSGHENKVKINLERRIETMKKYIKECDSDIIISTREIFNELDGLPETTENDTE